MAQHIVLLKSKAGVSDEAIMQEFDQAKHLPVEIDGSRASPSAAPSSIRATGPRTRWSSG